MLHPDNTTRFCFAPCPPQVKLSGRCTCNNQKYGRTDLRTSAPDLRGDVPDNRDSYRNGHSVFNNNNQKQKLESMNYLAKKHEQWGVHPVAVAIAVLVILWTLYNIFTYGVEKY